MKYLYNGVELPALPEWDKTQYPCAVIIYSPLFGVPQWKLYACPEFIYRKTDSSYQFGCSRHKIWTSGGAGWTAQSDVAEERYITSVGSSSVKWTNQDIFNEDGTVWLAASEPVPVTDHNARIMGWIVGKRLAAQRGKA